MISSSLPKLAAFRESSVGRFWVIVTVERIAVSVLLAIICDLLGFEHRSDLNGFNSAQLVILGLFLVPLVETFFLQSVPFAIARAFSFSATTTLALCWLPFAFLHVPSGMATFVSAGLGSGYYLSQTYVGLGKSSFFTAYWLTSASHAVLNAIALVGLICQKGL